LTRDREQPPAEREAPRIDGLTRHKVVRALARLLKDKTEERKRVEGLREIDR